MKIISSLILSKAMPSNSSSYTATTLGVRSSAPVSDTEIMTIDSTETSQTSTFAEPENTPVNAEIDKPLSAKAQGKQPAKMSQDPKLCQDPNASRAS